MATAVGHVGIVVRDLNLMIEFFTAGLGLTLSTRFRRRGKFPESVTKAIGADLEIKEYCGASVKYSVGARDLGDQRILE